MTVGELKELLKEYPDNMLVLKPGHPDGGGLDDIWDVKECTVCQNERSGWRGKYREGGLDDVRAVEIN